MHMLSLNRDDRVPLQPWIVPQHLERKSRHAARQAEAASGRWQHGRHDANAILIVVCEKWQRH